MPAVPVVLTDRLAAPAWRLAGARVFLVEGGNGAETFAAACADAELVLVDARIAADLPLDALARARRGTKPLVLVVPVIDTVEGEKRPPDAIAGVRQALGVAQ